MLAVGASPALAQEGCPGIACDGPGLGTGARKLGPGNGLLLANAGDDLRPTPDANSGELSYTAGVANDAESQYDVAGLVDAGALGHASGQTAARARFGYVSRRARIPAATAYAAPLTASEDTCMGSRSFGFQVMGFGVSLATTWEDRSCRRLKNARQLAALGYRSAAVALLCLDDEVYAAMERAGTPCPGVQLTRAEAPPPPTPELEAEPPLISFDDVLFDFDRSTLRPAANAILEPLLAMLRADPAMSIDIEGHTDWIGTDAYNQGLSQRRAQAVVDWLVARGVARDRISAVGRGESAPIATNETAEGRQLNRRVEIRRRLT
jgi:outer membrane protein OmpA-like peptidoglycan-associated protein